MIDTEYQAQIFLQSTKGEVSEVFFRRVQRAIWENLPIFFPEIERDGKGVLDVLPFEKFSTHHNFHTGLDAVNHITGRNLETARLCSHAITISRAGESAHVKDASDNTFKTEICIEAPKGRKDLTGGVRFSYMTRILYQPFAGFYPLAENLYDTPAMVEAVLSIPDCEATFFPRIDKVKDHIPQFKYPVHRKIIRVRTREEAEDFLLRLADRARPVPFLVFFGKSARFQVEALYFKDLVYTKAWVYIIDSIDLVSSKIGDIVKGIDIHHDFKKRCCRLFFPFGSYIPNDFGNPSYRVTLFGRKAYRNQVLNGLLRFFDLGEPGWRRTQRDVHMVQLDLVTARKMSLKEDEVSDSRQAVAKKDAIISMVLDERRKEQEAIAAERKEFKEDRELFEGENKCLEEENKGLSSENANLTGQVSALKQQLKVWQESRQQTDFKFGVESCYPNEVYDHLVEILRSANGNIPTEQRRHRQIYDAIVAANEPTGEMQRRKDEIAKLVRNQSGVSAGTITAFERLGFTYSCDGKHHKFTMGSFFMTLPCTGSDSQCGWKNSIRDFNRNFFVPTKGES